MPVNHFGSGADSAGRLQDGCSFHGLYSYAIADIEIIIAVIALTERRRSTQERYEAEKGELFHGTHHCT
jgi:hypothetical protein